MHDDPIRVVESLLAREEAEWVEFKHNNGNPAGIGENISAVSNAARLHQREIADIVWGIEGWESKGPGNNVQASGSESWS